MERKTLLAIGAALALVALLGVAAGGIIGVGPPEDSGPVETDSPVTETISSTGDENASGKAPKKATIEVELRNYQQWTQPDAPILVEVETHGRGYKNLTYRGLRLCMYSENGTVLFGEQVGEIRSSTYGEFYNVYKPNATLDEKPTYILVDHPELRHDERVMVDILVWDAETEQLDQITSRSPHSLAETLNRMQDRFQFPRHDAVGRCG